MSEWKKFVAIIEQKDIGNILVLFITFVLTVIFDLVVAIAVGIVFQLLIVFLKKVQFKKTK